MLVAKYDFISRYQFAQEIEKFSNPSPRRLDVPLHVAALCSF